MNQAGRNLSMNAPSMSSTYLIDKIVRALEGKGVSPSTGESGARTSRVMDEVVAEYYKATSENARVNAGCWCWVKIILRTKKPETMYAKPNMIRNQTLINQLINHEQII